MTENTVKKNSTGLIIAVLTLAAVVVLALGILAWASGMKSATTSTSIVPNPSAATAPSSVESIPTQVLWSFNGQAWTHTGKAPACTEPLTFKSPVDLDLATNVLYPGQVRGGNYKPHGGFIFGNLPDNNVDVKMPINAVLWRGSRYIEQGEVQIMLDFIAPCGVMVRFDHLLTLAPEFAAIVDKELPAAQPDASGTTNFRTTKSYPAGTLIATAVGHPSTHNVSMDWGVYDLRQSNEISHDATWAQAHPFKETAHYAICWLNNLIGSEKARALTLPGSGTEGKVSDYCK